MKYAIFTKPIHVEKIVNYLTQYTSIDFVITTRRYEFDAYDFDIGVSYCCPYIIDVESEKRKDKRWYNYHPGLLPKYKGPHECEMAIKEKRTSWGVTLHKMTNKLDSGEIVAIKKFKLQSPPVTTNEIGSISHYYLFQLFKETIEKL